MKIKLVENFSVYISKENICIPEKNVLVESGNSKYESKIFLKNVPITKYTENLNGRVYSRKLWENVFGKNTFEGSLCLADHPLEEKDESVTRISGIWKNFRLTENYGVADLYLIGNFGKLLFEVVNNSGKAGFSTVGFGELMEDNKTVIPESYEYERTDWVLNPSQQVFATLENAINEEENKKEEIFKEKITNNKEKFLEEEKRNVNMTIEKMNEVFNIKNQVRVAIKEALTNKKYSESIGELKSLKELVPSDIVEVHTKLDNTISELQEKIKTEGENAAKILVEKENSIKELETKLEQNGKSLKELNEKYEKVKSLVESGKLKEKDKLSKNLKEAKNIIQTLLSERKIMKNDIKHLCEDHNEKDSDINQFMEDRKNMSDDITIFKKERKDLFEKVDSLKKKLSYAEKHVTKLEKILEDEYGYEFEDEEEYPMEDENSEIIPEEDIELGDEGIQDVDGVEEYEFDNKFNPEEYEEPSLEDELIGDEDINDEEIIEEESEDEDILKSQEDDEMEVEDEEEDIESEEIQEASDWSHTSPNKLKVTTTNIKDEMKKGKGSTGWTRKSADATDVKKTSLGSDMKKGRGSSDWSHTSPEGSSGYEKVDFKAKMKKGKEGMGENIKTNPLKKKIMEFYGKEVKKNPSLRDIRVELLESRSLVEAVRKIQLFKEGNSEVVEMQETLKEKSNNRLSFLGNGRL